MLRCHRCGSKRVVDSPAPYQRRLAGHLFHGILPSVSCTECGHVSPDDESAERFELYAARMLCSASSDGAVVRIAREALGLEEVALARLLEVPVETVRRWQRESPVYGGALAMLAALVEDRLAGLPLTAASVRARLRAVGSSSSGVRAQAQARAPLPEVVEIRVSDLLRASR